MYVDDTKVKKKVNCEEDVEELQAELDKLDMRAKSYNMECNKKKFPVKKYSKNEDLKENPIYPAENYDEVIEQFSTLRDLGLQLSDNRTTGASNSYTRRATNTLIYQVVRRRGALRDLPVM